MAKRTSGTPNRPLKPARQTLVETSHQPATTKNLQGFPFLWGKAFIHESPAAVRELASASGAGGVARRECQQHNERLSNATIPRMANLDAVVKELQQERDRLNKAIATLTSLNGTTPKASQRRTMSAAARRRIAAAQRARWARQKKTAQNASVIPWPKRRKISAAGIARIRAAAKRRWAKVRAAKKH